MTRTDVWERKGMQWWGVAGCETGPWGRAVGRMARVGWGRRRGFGLVVWAVMLAWSHAALAGGRAGWRRRGRVRSGWNRPGARRWAKGRRRGWDPERGPAGQADSGASGRRLPSAGSSGGRARSLSDREAARRARAAARAVSRALARFDWEPSVRQVQRRALAEAKLRGPAVTMSRIRGAAALPELRIGLDMGRLQTSTSRREAGSPVRLTDRSNDDKTWSVEGKWRLDRLIFDPNELKLQTLKMRRRELRVEVLAQVTRLYFLRRRLQALEILRPARSVRTALARRLAIERLTGELDSLTGGWFSASLRRRLGP